MNKKLRFALLPLLMLVTSCGDTPLVSANSAVESNNSAVVTSESSAAEGYVPVIKEPTEITLWSITGKNNQAQLQSYVDSLMAKEPNIIVNNVIQTGMGYNDLKTAVVNGFAANNYPDMVQCYPDHVTEYIKANKAVKLDDYIDNKDYGWTAEDKADIIETFLEEGKEYTTEGTYSVPYCKSTEAMYYNADVLIGLNLSGIDATINEGKPLTATYLDNLTWNELFDKLCPAIVSYNDSLDDTHKIIKNFSTTDAKSAVFGYDSDDNLFITLAQQYGIGYTSIKDGKGNFDFGEGDNKTKMEALLTKWHEYATKGYVMSKGSRGGTSDDYVNYSFTAGECLFSVGSTGGYKYQFSTENPMNVGVARIPQADDMNTNYVMNQGPSLAILDHQDDNKKVAAWLLYKEITNEENSLDWAMNSGYMGIRHSNASNKEFIESCDETQCEEKSLDRLSALNKAYCGRDEVQSGLFTTPAFVGSSTARTDVGGIMTKILTKTNTLDDLDKWFTDAYADCKLAQ